MTTREQIVASARSWLGTPYHHQASVRGVGCDCLGLIRGLWRELLGAEPEAMPAYTRDWGDVTGSEPLLDAAHRCFCAGGSISRRTWRARDALAQRSAVPGCEAR
jgi:NlpC/P60 family putative phage cell wall peptidase